MKNEVSKVDASTPGTISAESEKSTTVKGDYTGYFYRSIENLNRVVDELYAEIIILKQNKNGGS